LDEAGADEQLVGADASFPGERFIERAVLGLEALELMARSEHIAAALASVLPDDFEEAADLMERSLGPVHERDENLGLGMEPFHYLPHVCWVARHGVSDARFDRAMRLQEALTRRFSAEFSIRAYWAFDPERTMVWLKRWVASDDAHLRRLASEGMRPRLPWARRLPDLIEDPSIGLAIIEPLRADPSSMVRRSVANHLNDISKDHPALVCEVCERWVAEDGGEQRCALVKHALRTLIKRGDLSALKVLGYDGSPEGLSIQLIAPAEPVPLGQRAKLSIEVKSQAQTTVYLLLDLVVHMIKARGASAPRTFKLTEGSIEPNASRTFKKTISFAPMSTRANYPGVHRVEALLNGHRIALGSFEVVEP
jgi:3-methyladenine DNA glycosylase AlkC